MGSQHCGRGELELVGLLRVMSWLLVVVLVSLLLARSRRFDDGLLGNNLAGELVKRLPMWWANCWVCLENRQDGSSRKLRLKHGAGCQRVLIESWG